jgi:enolase
MKMTGMDGKFTDNNDIKQQLEMICLLQTERLSQGLKKESNSILIKVNQIGTLTETIAVNMAKKCWLYLCYVSPFW